MLFFFLNLSGAGLDGAKGFVADDGGIDDDEGGVGMNEAFEEKFSDSLLDDIFAFGPIERKAAGTHAVVEGKLASEGGSEGEGVDGRDAGAEGGGDAGHASRAGEEKDSLGSELVGEMDAGGDDAIGLAFGMNLFLISDRAGSFDAAGDAIEHFETGAGVLSGGGFARKHNGISPFENGVGDVGNLRSSGQGLGDHAFEHVRGDDDGLHGGDALFDDATLNDGELLVRAFHAQISTGDHDGICDGDDAEDIFDGELVFDLGDNFDLWGVVLVEEGAEGRDVVGITDKGERDPIDACFQSDEKIGGIFLGDGGEIDADAREVDVATISESTGGEDAAVEGVGVFFDDLEVNDAVVDKEFLPGLEIMNEVGIVDGNGGGRSLGINGEDEGLIDFELAGGANGTRADGGTLSIEEQGNFLATIGGEGTKFRNHLANKVVGSVRHVQSKYFGAPVDQLGEGLRIGVFGAESGDEFGTAGVR